MPEPSVGRIEAESFELRDPDTAVLVVCIVDDGERYDAASGELLTDGQPGTGRFEAALHRVDGRWVLAEQLLQEEWPGVAGCATEVLSKSGRHRNQRQGSSNHHAVIGVGSDTSGHSLLVLATTNGSGRSLRNPGHRTRPSSHQGLST